jgi:hypothetical protein
VLAWTLEVPISALELKETAAGSLNPPSSAIATEAIPVIKSHNTQAMSRRHGRFDRKREAGAERMGACRGGLAAPDRGAHKNPFSLGK